MLAFIEGMTKEDALQFLCNHQPMPPDEEWTEELAKQYDQVRQFFINHPDPACIPLFLHSFGNRNGLGIYQLVDEVFQNYKPAQVVPHLTEALDSKHESVRYWTAQVCMDFPNERLIEPVLKALKYSNEDTRYFCYLTLQYILEDAQYDYAEQVEPIIDEGLTKETYHGLIELLSEIKENIKKNRC